MDEFVRLDEVSVFGDKLRFLIPHEWEEKDDGADLHMYCAPNAKSGWFRVSLITIQNVQDPPQRLREITAEWEAPSVDEETGNVIASWEKDSTEDGVPIHLYYWKVANAVPPDKVREAVFSYTVLTEDVNNPETQQMIGILQQLVSRASFQ